MDEKQKKNLEYIESEERITLEALGLTHVIGDLKKEIATVKAELHELRTAMHDVSQDRIGEAADIIEAIEKRADSLRYERWRTSELVEAVNED